MDSSSKSFLGKGVAFPFNVDKSTGKINMAVFEEDIKQSINIILHTYMGERVMRPTFGSRLEDYLFDENTKETAYGIQNEVFKALVKWEPRITDVKVEAELETEKSRIVLNIEYLVRSTNNMFNVVYPFYTLEGTGSEEFER